ncbi:transposase [Pedobacter changchengzhani]|uniref:Transposase n=1 Tax=Pedobacter changchengzhani TaxID=2529274 RepID=A0A4R5MHZ7_9SPHI|nr:transposase [Pedobacter changchengzhani]TDG35168.1 transposase [Pedobacter changchengzhani]
MKKNRKHSVEFKLEAVNKKAQGESVSSLSKSLGISPSLVWKWVDEYTTFGKSGFLTKQQERYTVQFRMDVVSYHKQKGISLRESCMRFGIRSQSTLYCWLTTFDQYGCEGLKVRYESIPNMERRKTERKIIEDLSRLEELEKENLYLRAENDFLKKLDALTQKRQTPPRKKR